MTRCPSCHQRIACVAVLGHCGHDDCRAYVEGYDAAVSDFWRGVCEQRARERKEEAQECRDAVFYEERQNAWAMAEAGRLDACAAQLRAWAAAG